MALIATTYTPPGVYTTEVFTATTPTLLAGTSLPVIIGEGQQFFTQSNVELHRGSSATADDAIVGENISDQVTGATRTYQLTHYPVVTGNGTGTVTNTPSYISVYTGSTANPVPVPVVSLNGSTGQFMTQSLIPVGTNVWVNYFFKKTDTLITAENDSFQIPSFATLNIQSQLTLGLSIPGDLGNLVNLAFTMAANGSGVSDINAVTGNGTDTISIELMNTDNTIRSFADIAALVTAGISTPDGGFLTVASTASTAASTAPVAMTPTFFTGGGGQSTNAVYQLQNLPVVDGTNGGVVTTDPTLVQAFVNGVAVTVSALDGSTGMVTLATGVPAGSVLTFNYYTNTYMDTSDALPAGNVSAITLVGYGPNVANFIEGVDYVLNGNSISWGASATTTVETSTAGFSAFDATVINNTLVDDYVYLRPVQGAVTGRNSVFTLQDTPVNGSGLDRATNVPSLVNVYVGPDPITALASGPVRVASVAGALSQVTLYNPPTLGQNVYASYYMSNLDDHEFTMAVDVAGGPGLGTVTITDELGQIAPVATVGAASVADAAFTDLGIVWPDNFPDLQAALGGAAETITLTFQNDSLTTTLSPAIQASLTVDTTIMFTATTPGVAGNSVTISLVGGPTGYADASAISVTGTAITVYTLMADNETTRTWQDIINLFVTYPVSITGAGTILCTAVTGAVLTGQASSLAATSLGGGVAAETEAYANRYLVTTSRTASQAQTDGLGLTGGATTPASSNVGSTAVGLSGYLGQTYIDPITDVQFTIVDPATALSYGYVQLPSPRYTFAPGDTLTFVISTTTGHATGSTPTIAIPGLQTQVVTTLDMNPGDTVMVQTFNNAGSTPDVGDYYYVSFTTEKQPTDMGLTVYNSLSACYAAYGQPNTVTNRLSIAASLLVGNGASQFACIQVPVQTGLTTAADASFITAINSLTAPIPGTSQKAGIILPLSTSADVQQALSVFLTKQATARNKGEATGYVGFGQFASATTIATTAAAIANQRVIAVTPNMVGFNMTAPGNTVAVENLLTGEFVACALAGLSLDPTNDVATTLTNQLVVGFTRSLVSYDEPTLNSLAASGVTCLTNVPGALSVRHFKTTNPSNPLTSEPYVTTTADYINQSFRAMLKQFIGRKMTSDLPSSIQIVLNAALTNWLGSIIQGYGQLTVVPDSIDPTTIDITVPIQPMFSLLYLNVTLQVNLS